MNILVLCENTTPPHTHTHHAICGFVAEDLKEMSLGAMRPLPLWLPSLLLCGLGAAASSPDSFSQLAAPLNPRLHLYNDEQILTWEPSPSSNDPRPVVYQVEYSFIDGSWHRLLEPNCTDITETKCDLTGGGRLKLFPHPFTVFLRVRAKRGNLTSKWVGLEPFQHYENVTVGPPKTSR